MTETVNNELMRHFDVVQRDYLEKVEYFQNFHIARSNEIKRGELRISK